MNRRGRSLAPAIQQISGLRVVLSLLVPQVVVPRGAAHSTERERPVKGHLSAACNKHLPGVPWSMHGSQDNSRNASNCRACVAHEGPDVGPWFLLARGPSHYRRFQVHSRSVLCVHCYDAKRLKLGQSQQSIVTLQLKKRQLIRMFLVQILS